MKILPVLAKTSRKTEIELCRSALFYMKTRACPKYFVNHFLWKQFLDSNLLRTTSSLICFPIFVNLRPLTQFQLKVRATNLPKSAKICLT